VVGRGNVSAGNRLGDLFVIVNVMEPAPSESMFKRSGSDLTVEVCHSWNSTEKQQIPLPFYKAIMGAAVQVPTLDGEMVSVKLPPGTQPNEKRILAGRGVQKLSQPFGVKGNLNVIFKIAIPKFPDLTPEQQKSIEQFKAVTEKRDSPVAPERSPDRTSSTVDDNAKSEDAGFFKKTIGRIKDSMCDREEEDKNAKKSGEKS
jgi:molecular chaperone DnaJ